MTTLLLSWSPSTLQTLLLLGTGILYLVALSIYRISFHPLASYPGPLLSKLSGYAVYLQAITTDRHLIHLRPVVRIGPNQLSFSDPSAVRQIYQSGRQTNPLRKAAWYETIDAPSGAYSTHSEVSRGKHAWRRRVLDHAFSDASLRSAEIFVVENVNDFCEIVNRDTQPGEWSDAREMSSLCTWLAYDMMGDLVFGERFNCLTSPEHRYVPNLLMSSSGFIYPVAHLPFQSIVRPIISSSTLMNILGGQLARDEHKYVSYANDRVTARLAMNEKKTDSSTDNARLDMMHHLIHALGPHTSRPFTRADLDAESSLLIAAGADTTSTTLAAALFYLTLPSSLPILSCLQSLLRNNYPSVEDIRSPSIVKDVYLRAVVDETLRLAPPVPTHLPREVISNSDGGIAISSSFIPSGTTVGCSAYVLHHGLDAYPDSFEFKPERWIPHPDVDLNPTMSSSDLPLTPTPTHLPHPSPLQSPGQVSAAKEAFAPFSHGARGCVGKQLAYLELSLCLARLLWTYDIRRAPETSDMMPLTQSRKKRGWNVREDEYQLFDRFLADKEGPWVQFRSWCKEEKGDRSV